ncbi:hypothetical protein [Sphaerisporangium rhizosphaerae]|uniref:DUF3040 domain-containing protein n=1 Tax=Sphaerisporangium rhizosphaerae TaxID=2269375 RepID=A0ABW2NZC2_9ACTN
MALLKAEMQEKKDRRKHILQMAGLFSGLVTATALLVAAVIVGIAGEVGLALAFCGPSMITLVAIFVLRRLDSTNVKAASMAQSTVLPVAPSQAVTEAGNAPLV